MGVSYAVRWCSHRVWVLFYTIGCRPRSHHCAPWAPARARAARPRLKYNTCAAPPGGGAPRTPFALELPGLAGTARNLAGLTIRPMTRNDLNHKVKWLKGPATS